MTDMPECMTGWKYKLGRVKLNEILLGKKPCWWEFGIDEISGLIWNLMINPHFSYYNRLYISLLNPCFGWILDSGDESILLTVTKNCGIAVLNYPLQIFRKKWRGIKRHCWYTIAYRFFAYTTHSRNAYFNWAYTLWNCWSSILWYIKQ